MRLPLIFAAGLALMFSTACSHSKKVESKSETAKLTGKAPNKDEKTINKDQKIADKTLKCLVGKDERVVLLDKEPQRCEVHYTKFGEKSQVAWAEATPSLCTDVFQKIRSNIEEKGFKCQLDKPSKELQAVNKADTPRDTASSK